jgi:hypothetical protein
MRFWVISQFAQLRIVAHLDYSATRGKKLCYLLMPRPKFGRSCATTPAAATIRLVHLKVVHREQMAIAADLGYGHRLEDAFQR